MRIPLPDWIVSWLLSKAAGHPSKYFPLYNPDGTLYMEREWLRSFNEGTPSARIHKIFTPDYDDYPHDHPWSWNLTWILHGDYMEELTLPWGEKKLKWRKRGAIVLRKASTRHRIVSLHSGPAVGPVITLFVMGKYCSHWGFFTPTGQKIPWREFDRARSMAAERMKWFTDPTSGLDMTHGKFYIIGDSGFSYTKESFETQMAARAWWINHCHEHYLTPSDITVPRYTDGSFEGMEAANIVAADDMWRFLKYDGWIDSKYEAR